MESAGLSWQSLSAWKAGTRTPRPDNIRAVGQVLLLRADKLARVGQQLIDAAAAEERLRVRQEEEHASAEALSLFDGAEG
jgi:hypothetical protein